MTNHAPHYSDTCQCRNCRTVRAQRTLPMFTPPEPFELPDCDTRVTFENELFGQHTRFRLDIRHHSVGMEIGVTAYWPNGTPVGDTKWYSIPEALKVYRAEHAQKAIHEMQSSLARRLSAD